MTVAHQQRHTKAHRCPVCGGADGDPRGQGKRCSGFTSDDGDWCHCSREELAGGIAQEDGGTYAHRMRGPCKCGTVHNADNRVRDEIEATYPYHDETGALLYEVVRKTGKRFLQRKPDGTGGWEWRLNGVRRVPYRFRELLEDDGDRPVHIVEGEKDADALAKRGQTATTNPGGAGKWSAVADVARTALQGRDVVVIADNDEVGRRHALEVAASLHDVARSVRVTKCPAPHKDVSDHLAAGGTLEQLVDLDAIEGPTSADPLRGLVHLAKVALFGRKRILEVAARPVAYFWDGIASAGQIVLVASGPGEGKTTLICLCIVARANLGEPVAVLGRRVVPAPAGLWIVWVQAEHGESSSARKLVRSCGALQVSDECLDRVIILARKDVRLGSVAWIEIEQMIAAGIVSDIVIDTLARVAPGEANDEREQAEAFAVISHAIELAPSTDKPVAWIAAHTRKVDGQKSLADVSGSAQRTGQADTVLLLDATRADRGKVVHSHVVFAKLREDPDDEWPSPVTFSVSRDKAGAIAYRCDASAVDDGAPIEEKILRVLAVAAQTKSGLSKALGRNKEHIEEALTALFSARRIRTTTRSVNGRPFKAFELAESTPSEGASEHRTRAPYSPDRDEAPDLAPDSHRTLDGEDA